MRLLLRLVALAVSLVVLFFVAIFAASELGGENVVLETHDGAGMKSTHLWVVDDAGHAWLRAGVPTSGWLQRIEANPDVFVTRKGQKYHFTAVPVHDPATRDRIHALMRQNYPFADRLVSLIRDGTKSVPVRLDEVAAAP